MAETNLAQALEITDGASSYDANIKYLLADKQVLMRILKYAVSEFRDMALEEIGACIGSDIEIGTVPIDAGMTNLERVSGTNVEDNVPGEGQIFFDIRFSAYIRNTEMKILINIEAQKSSAPQSLGYHLENRIIFYMSRMISAQKHTEFYHSNYDDLKRVRSIWICMDSDEDGDFIEEIALHRRTVFGRGGARDIELVKGIVINIRDGENLRESKNMLISMLEELISRADAEEKKRILAEKYGMVMTVELEGRLNTMCNWSEAIIERALKEGMEKGMAYAVVKMLEDVGKVPETLKAMIMEQENTDVMKKWNRAAAMAQSIEDFEEKIGLAAAAR